MFGIFNIFNILNNINKLKLEIEKLKLEIEELKLDKINIRNIPIINTTNIHDYYFTSYDDRKTINFNTNIEELDLSDIDIIDESKINWLQLTQFYNLKIIIFNYYFDGHILNSYIFENIKLLNETIIFRTVNFLNIPNIKSSCILIKLLETIVIIVNKNIWINLKNIIIEDLTKHIDINNVIFNNTSQTYSSWYNHLNESCNWKKNIKLTIT